MPIPCPSRAAESLKCRSFHYRFNHWPPPLAINIKQSLIFSQFMSRRYLLAGCFPPDLLPPPTPPSLTKQTTKTCGYPLVRFIVGHQRALTCC